MPPSSGDAQTPEPKNSTNGLVNVFKSLTGGKPSRSPNSHTPPPLPPQLSTITTSQPTSFGGPPNYEQLYEQLKIGNPLPDRLLAADSIRHAVKDFPLSGVTSIFKEGKDLIEPTKAADARVIGFQLLTACVQNTFSTDPERLAYFQVLTAPANPEDFHLQLASLVELAKHGKDLSGFHYHTLPLLTNWLRECFAATAAARRAVSSRNRSKSKAPLAEETNLSLLFAFIIDVIKFSFNASSDETAGHLLDAVLHICLQTPVSTDLRACINVIDAIVTYGEIPRNKLVECIKVLCAIHCLVEDVESEAWRSIRNLCRSHNGQTTVRILLDILRYPPTAGGSGNHAIREIRGALSVLEKLFAKGGEKGYPLVPFTLLVHALNKVVSIKNTKVDSEALHLILSLFGDEGDEVPNNVMDEDWTLMFDVVVKCSRRGLDISDDSPAASRSRMASPLGQEEMTEQNLVTSLGQTLHSLIIRVESLLIKFKGVDFYQREDCFNFLVRVHTHLPESSARLVIDYFMDYRLCYPTDLDWKRNIRTILEGFFDDRSQPTHIRLHAIEAVTDVYQVVEMMDDQEDPNLIVDFVSALLDDTGDEKDIAVLQELVTFAVAVAEKADHALFDKVIDAIRGSVTSDRLQSSLGSPSGSRHSLSRPTSSAVSNHNLVQTPSNITTKGFIQIFMRTMDKSTYKSLRMFEEILFIAKSHDCETDARISALKMLLRLRADWANRVFLILHTESDGLAASLYRTAGSLARKKATDEAAQQQRSSRGDDMSNSRLSRSTSFGQGHQQSRQPVRLGSGASRTLQRNHQMWMYPDPDALPETPSDNSSSRLSSVVQVEDDQKRYNATETALEDGLSDSEPEVEQNGVNLPPRYRATLNIETYLETVKELLLNGCDWEVYSFILVHLPSQLTNQALFKDEFAIRQMQELRKVLCDLLKNNSFQEPPISSGLRKADVAICLFQILNMVMGYHQHFQKSQQDEIVQAFMQGIGSTWERTAKCCIHALSICCHEMPGSTSKSLMTILQKMSTIITQSHVAVHILEFLACLARLPDLYVNFREEEYRTVFAICFRYLQYVRDQPAKDGSLRGSYSHGRNSSVITEHSVSESNVQPNTSDDLPQYVYALAYHVIIFWFLSLKLTDRAGHVSWITKNLVSVDANGKERMDEQAQVTIDFMQRVAYADVDESKADPTFTSDRFGEILKKRWIVGQSVVTVEQATRGGWAQITKRQPSGTSCYIIREKFSRPPAHQSPVSTDSMRDTRHNDNNMVLPSHLMLQLTASIPQTAESIRPVPLPMDAMTDRAIKSLDRNFTVDGHKVGVIYIGENQTNEVEILANIMGSTDYTDFLSGLGTLTKLKGAEFNTQGLDRFNDSHGEYAFCWRDRVSEIVFHVTTQMPTDLERDPQCIGKKQHIGNDFVNIIFNNSGHPFRFDTFPSEFNYVNIVITPESRASFVATRFRSIANAKSAFYKVQVMSKPGFPEISPAAETKIMSLEALPGFIRLLALNASVFSLVWANREGGEHVSSWRNRLREINRLKEKYGAKPNPASTTSPPGTANGNIRDSVHSLRRSSVANFLTNASEPGSQRSSVLSTAETEVGGGGEESLVDSLDFSRWA